MKLVLLRGYFLFIQIAARAIAIIIATVASRMYISNGGRGAAAGVGVGDGGASETNA